MNTFAAIGLIFAAVASPGDRLVLANRFARMGMHAEACAEYEAIQNAKDVAQDEVLYGLGESANKLGRKEKALEAYGALLSRFPASKLADYARLNRALLLEGAAREKELRLLDRDGVPKAVRDMARFALAPVLAASDDAAERRRALAIYLDLAASPDPKVVEEAVFFAAMLDYREAKYAEAAALYARLRQKFPAGARAAEARVYAAWSEHLAKHPAAALKVAADALAAGENGEVREDLLYIKATSLKSLERRGEAVSAYTELIREYPEGRYVDAAWRERIAIRAAERDHAGVLADAAARGDWPAEGAARALTYAYESAAAVTNWTLAVRYARRAAAAGGELAPRALYLAAAYESRLGLAREAREDWTALLVKHPDSPFAADALRARGMEELRQEDFKAANRSLGELARRFPARAADAETLFWSGVAARGADDAPESERLFRAALAAKPSPEVARDAKLELAFLLEKKGDRKAGASLLAELLDTKAVDRMTPASLAWTAETLLEEGTPEAAASAAQAARLLERRPDVDAAWRQTAAALLGRAEERRGALDAAGAAYARALAQDARTPAGARAALSLGRLETAVGAYDQARAHLSDAAERAVAPALSDVRAEAYAALAANETKRGDLTEALKYHLLVGTLFDHAKLSPAALKAAADICDEQGRKKEADDLRLELRTRYGK